MAKTNQERIEALESGYNQLANQTDLLSKHIDGIQEILKNILDKVDPKPLYKPTLGDFIKISEVTLNGSVVDTGLVVGFDAYGVKIGRFSSSYEWKTKKYFYEDNLDIERIETVNITLYDLTTYDNE